MKTNNSACTEAAPLGHLSKDPQRCSERLQKKGTARRWRWQPEFCHDLEKFRAHKMNWHFHPPLRDGETTTKTRQKSIFEVVGQWEQRGHLSQEAFYFRGKRPDNTIFEVQMYCLKFCCHCAGSYPPPTQIPPLKRGILWAWRFSCRKSKKCKAPIDLAHRP